MLTLVLKKVAHPRPAREHKLGHILDDFGLFLGRESCKPLGQALQQRFVVSFFILFLFPKFPSRYPSGGWATRDAPLCLVATGGSGIWTKELSIQEKLHADEYRGFSLDSHDDCW